MNAERCAIELYKLCCRSNNYYGHCLVSESGWVSSAEFYVWIQYPYLYDFMGRLNEIFHHGLFDDNYFKATMLESGACIDLCEALGGYLDVEDLEKAFPKKVFALY